MRSGIAACILAICSSFLTMIALDELGYLNHGDSPIVIVDPDTPPIDNQPIDLRDSYLVVVSESKSRPVDQVMVLDDHAFWHQWIESNGMQYHLFDPDDPDAASYVAAAATSNIPPPFVMWSRGGRVLDVMPFPKSTAGIKTMLGK